MNEEFYEEGQPCPVCGSDKITERYTYQMTVHRNCKTGKVIKREKNYENSVPVFWDYKCRKCGWQSSVFTE